MKHFASGVDHPLVGYKSMLHSLFFQLKTIIYPPKCLKCGKYIDLDIESDIVPLSVENNFCEDCYENGVSFIDPPYCKTCGMKFKSGQGQNHLCGTCIKKPLNLARVRASAEYKGILKDAVQLLKYDSRISLAKVFEKMLFKSFVRHFGRVEIDLIIPVPLHIKRLKERGFNQAYLMIRNFPGMLKKHTGKSAQWKIDFNSLIRVKQTQPQTGLDIDQRKKNLANAFRVQCENRIDNKNILLIDDVFTTGATCNEAAGILLQHGAKKVSALVLART